MTHLFQPRTHKIEDLTMPPRIFLPRSEVAEIFNVSPNTITRWADAGKLPFVRTLGGHRRYEKHIIIELVNSQLNEQEPIPNEEEERVKRVILEIPKLYGDHHVAPIQKLLANRFGIQNVWITPAHRQVHIDFASESVSEAQIRAWLVDGGYPPADTPTPEPIHPIKDLAWDRTALRMTQTHGIRS